MRIFKKIYLGCVILFLGIATAHAQCDNDVSTDPTNPTNNALPKDLLNPNGDERYLNGTEWFPLTAGGSLEDYDLANMFWSGTPLEEMDNIWSLSIPYYNYINASPRPTPKNGWELLLINIGRYPNYVDTLDNNETFQALPYIIIYNRYSGIVRVFANFGLDQLVGDGPDAVEVVMSFVLNNDNSGSTGLARLYNGKDLALDQNSKVTTMKSIAKATSTQRQWFSTDFQIAYDPCTCFYPSKIQLSFNQITQENIMLHGRSLSVDDNLIDNNLQIDPMTFLSGFDASGNDAEKGGILIYKGLQNLVDDYIRRYEKYKEDLTNANKQNKVVDHNLNVLEGLKYTLTAVFTLGTNPSAISTGPIQGEDWFKNLKKTYGPFIKKADKLKTDNILKIAKKVLGSDVKTYIEQNYEKVPLPTEPDKNKVPSVTFTEMHFEGTISDSQVKGGPTFYTPGTYGTAATQVITPGTSNLTDPILQTMYEYPVYNEVLGTFALLNTPKITIANRYVPETVFENDYWMTQYANTVYYKAWTREYQLKISNDLVYALNKALDVKNHEIKAAFRFKAKTDVALNGQVYYNVFLDPKYTTNVDSKTYEVDIYDPWINPSGTPFTNSVQNNWTGYGGEYGDKDGNFQTSFVPLDALKNFTVGLGLKQEFFEFGCIGCPFYEGPNFPNEVSQGFRFEFYDIELVLMVDIEYDTKNEYGKNNTSTQILTFDIKGDQIQYSHEPYIYNLIDENLHNQYDVKLFNENLGFENIVFDGSDVKDCSLSGTEYNCRAWNNIDISGNLSTTGGYTVNIIAGNQIETAPESIISPEISLWIDSPFNLSNPMIHANNAQINTFCNSSTYKANKLDPMVAERTTNNQNVLFVKPKKENATPEEIYLYPNPADTYANLYIDKQHVYDNIKVEIYDMSTKKYQLDIHKLGNSSFAINIESLASGIYFVKVYDNNNLLKTLKLIRK
ncbi:T9SS type A sorting domain-containing protein [uncultured Kordia sp.]|uniref:T9SS type A sorting domain-containing protein n=1 Tax=uncultured Kordia sp. TaxID=507699 RepID=UPI00260A40B0|nr:T9SS type A sorting domain-containing protein [uncultured Kordia sp.]